MFHSSGLRETIEELLVTLVCEINEDCMFSKFTSCAGATYAVTLLQQILARIVDSRDNTLVQQGISGVRCSLDIIVLTKEEFSERFADMLNSLKTHHFVSKPGTSAKLSQA